MRYIYKIILYLPLYHQDTKTANNKHKKIHDDYTSLIKVFFGFDF